MDRKMQVKEVPTGSPTKIKYAVGSSAKHAVFQELGTRAHGPVKAKALRFKPKGSNTIVFAKWVRGVKAARFMKKTLQQLTVYDFLKK